MTAPKHFTGLALVLALGLAGALRAQARGPKPLSEANLIKLLELQIDEKAIVSKLEKEGIGFAADDATVDRLKKAGASDAVLAAVKKAGEAKPMAANGKPLVTFENVLELFELGIGEEQILTRLKDSPTTFTLSADQVANLKGKGATDRLIAALQSQRPADKAVRLTDLAIILDCSGSMDEKTPDGQTKMVAAKAVVSDMIDKLPSGLRVTFLVYGHDEKLLCQSVKVVRELGLLDDSAKAELKQFIAGLQPRGHTPIALALETAGKELAKKTDSACGLVLITDGMETCHRDPAGEAAKLAKNLNVTFGVNVVGFGLNEQEKQAVEGIAKSGKGKFYPATDAAELGKRVGELVRKVDEVADVGPKDRPDRKFEAAGKEGKPGMFLHDAPLVGPGEYKGGLAFMEAHYYQVPVRKGQELRVVGVVQKAPFKAYEIFQSFAVTIYNSDLTVAKREAIGVKGNPTTPATVRATWKAEADGIMYVAIAASDSQETIRGGHPQELYPKDQKVEPSPYTLRIRLEPEADAGAGPQSLARGEAKAGNGFPQAGELAVPVLAATDLKLGEVVFYRLKAQKGDTLQASVAVRKPWYTAYDIKATYTVTLYDDDQVQIAQKKFEVPVNPPEVQSLSIACPVKLSGNVYLSIGCENSGSELYPKDQKVKPGRVAVQVTKAGAAPAVGAKDPFKGAKADDK